MRDDFTCPISFDRTGYAHFLPISFKSQRLDVEESLDGVCLRALGFFDQFAYSVVQLVHARVWMPPAIAIGCGIELAQPFRCIRRIEQRGTGWNEQAYREVDGVDVLDQVSLFKEREKLQVAFQRFPGGERH